MMSRCLNQRQELGHGTLVVCSLILLFVCRAGALEWKVNDGVRNAALHVSGSKPGFVLLPGGGTGITFTNYLPKSRFTTNQIHLNGSGVAAGDIDDDGLCDLFFAGLGGGSTLYRNLGALRFADITKSAGIECSDLDATGSALADLDGDRDLDLIVNSIGNGVRLFINDGRGQFRRLASPAINQGKGGMSLALGDIDRDGDLDLYVVNYRTTTLRDMPYTRFRGKNRNGVMVLESVNGRPVTEPEFTNRFTINAKGGVQEHGEADGLFLNDGKGAFTLVPFTSGAFLDHEGRPLDLPPFDWGLSAMFRDINGDELPDIFVCNDFSSPDRIWINQGKGNFKAMPPLALRHMSLFSMGVDFADVNRDGHDDFFTVDMLSREYSRRQVQAGEITPDTLFIGKYDDCPQYSHNMLFVGRGDGTFAETAFFSGVNASEWSWAPIFLDVDLDGFEDLLVTTGHERDTMNADVLLQTEKIKAGKKLPPAEVLNLNNLFPRLATGNVAFRNRGDLTFEDVTEQWGFGPGSVSHGMALADLDNDGDLDVVVNRLNGAAGIYRNNSSAARIAVKLKGLSSNTHGVGAKIKVFSNKFRTQSQEMICGGRYLSSDQTIRVFAAGAETNHVSIEVLWPSGKKSTFQNLAVNHIYEFDEKSDVAEPERQPPVTNAPIFQDVSHLLNHRHHEELFDDFARQPLLPRKLSQAGPGVAWHDINNDGLEDLIISNGRGGSAALFLGTPQGAFLEQKESAFSEVASRDQTAVLGYRDHAIISISNYEEPAEKPEYLSFLSPRQAPSQNSKVALGEPIHTGPLAMADTDGDIDLDLFVGGRTVPGKYPLASVSLLLRNEGDRWSTGQRFEHVGIINGAVFSDLDSDGHAELVLACEWGPLRVFKKVNGLFKEITTELGLDKFTGWWNGVTTGDLNNDGRLDIVASNWGLNTQFRTDLNHPRKVFHGDLDSNGVYDLVETIYDQSLKNAYPDRGLRILSSALSQISERGLSFEAFSRLTAHELFGGSLKTLASLEANTFQSAIFLNRGGSFEWRPMPSEAQWSPAFGVSVSDMDGDGNEDVFLSQNFFAVHPEVTRHDGGRALWLRGDGRGNLAPLSAQQTGVAIYGEQRGTAVADFDRDGRIDLAVTQNGAETKLFRNIGAKRGLRVKLKGLSQNENAIGARVRIVYGEKLGPIKEIHAGSGYCSQNSSTLVFGLAEEPTGIQVHWPGGKMTTTPALHNMAELVVPLEPQ